MVETRDSELHTTLTVFPAISIGVLVLRLYARYLVRRFGWDNFLIIIAVILSTAAAVVSRTYASLNWQGYHSHDIPKFTYSYASTAGKWDLVNQVLYNPILATVRASIIAFLLSLEQVPHTIRRHLITIAVLNCAHFFAVLFPVLFQCHPFHCTYDMGAMDLAAQRAAGADSHGMVNGQLVKGGSCINRPSFYISTAVISIILDLWLLCLPTALVWRLKMSRRQKAMVVILLSFWVIATILGIVRLPLLAPEWLAPYGLEELHKTNYGTAFAFNSMETNVSIWTASAPAFKALITRLFPRLWHNKSEIRQSSDQSSSREEENQRTLSKGYREPIQPRGAFTDLVGQERRRHIQSELELIHFEHDINRPRLGSSYGNSTSASIRSFQHTSEGEQSTHLE